MNLFLKTKINPLLGAAGVSAVPDSARVVQMVGQAEDPNNFLLMHAMAPNILSGCIVLLDSLWMVSRKVISFVIGLCRYDDSIDNIAI
jgi:carboxybiotin decarboxylase